MRGWIAALTLSACALVSGSITSCAQTPIYDFWFYSNQSNGFLAAPKTSQISNPGVIVYTSGNSPAPEAALVTSRGYQLMNGIGGYSAQWAQNYSGSSGCAGNGNMAELQSHIDAEVSSGAKWIYVNEPCPAPGQSTAQSPTSIAYNVKGFNLIYNYIHSKHPGVMFGLTIGDDGGPALHLAMLKAGLKEDFASEEEYNNLDNRINPFIADGQKKLYPNVKTMILAYSTKTLCQPQNGAATYIKSGFDIIAFWDLDNYGGWIGPTMDGSWLQNAKALASGSMSFCLLPSSNISNGTWNSYAKNFSAIIWDVISPVTPYKIGTCDWMVMSGSGGIRGPNDPSMKVTLPLTTRSCSFNGDRPVVVTVGANGYCNVNGRNTCLVFVRAHTTTGLAGNVYYQEYSIDY